MTGWSDIITAAMQIVDDVRWMDELAVNPAQFYRAKSQLIRLAIPMLSKPPELLAYLEKDTKSPAYADMAYTSAEDTEAGAVLTVTTTYADYALCSASIRSADGLHWSPVLVQNYDAETGEVQLVAAAAGAQEYSLDFYTDGEFQTLSAAQLRLFALAVSVVWDNRFQRDWLSNTMKLKDSSFETVNESNYMEKANDRFLKNKHAFEDALRSYEQQCAYVSVVTGPSRTQLI